MSEHACRKCNATITIPHWTELTVNDVTCATCSTTYQVRYEPPPCARCGQSWGEHKMDAWWIEELDTLGIGFVYGDRDDERRLQRHFRKLHIRGEWFKPHKVLTRYVLHNTIRPSRNGR